MTDARRRDRERRSMHGGLEDRASFLSEGLRAGAFTRDDLFVAAALGDEAADAVSGYAGTPYAVLGRGWTAAVPQLAVRIAAHDPRRSWQIRVRVGLAIVHEVAEKLREHVAATAGWFMPASMPQQIHDEAKRALEENWDQPRIMAMVAAQRGALQVSQSRVVANVIPPGTPSHLVRALNTMTLVLSGFLASLVEFNLTAGTNTRFRIMVLDANDLKNQLSPAIELDLQGHARREVVPWLLGTGQAWVANPAHGDDYVLYPPGAASVIGPESGHPVQNGIAKFVSPHGSTRYVFYENGQAVSGLQVMSRDDIRAVIAYVYTVPGRRRHHLADRLLQRARQDFERVDHAPEQHLSQLGTAWRDSVGNPPVEFSLDKIREKFRRYNRELFGGVIPNVPIHLRKIKHWSGVTHFTIKSLRGESVASLRRRNAHMPLAVRSSHDFHPLDQPPPDGDVEVKIKSIDLSTNVIYDEAELDQLLVHEMIHAYLALTGWPFDDHGRPFLAEVARIKTESGLDVPLRHELENVSVVGRPRELGVLVLKPTRQDQDPRPMFVLFSPRAMNEFLELLPAWAWSQKKDAEVYLVTTQAGALVKVATKAKPKGGLPWKWLDGEFLRHLDLSKGRLVARALGSEHDPELIRF